MVKGYPPLTLSQRVCAREQTKEQDCGAPAGADGEVDQAQANCLQTWLQWLHGAGQHHQVTSAISGNESEDQRVDCSLVQEEWNSERQGEGLAERRRNPPRASRPPVDIDLGEWGYFLTPNPSCGRIPPPMAARIK